MILDVPSTFLPELNICKVQLSCYFHDLYCCADGVRTDRPCVLLAPIAESLLTNGYSLCSGQSTISPVWKRGCQAPRDRAIIFVTTGKEQVEIGSRSVILSHQVHVYVRRESQNLHLMTKTSTEPSAECIS